MKQKLTRLKFWEGHIKAWKSGNLSQTDYCRKNNLDRNLFSKWKRRNANAGFVEVKTSVPEHANNGDSIEISVRDAYKIRIKPNFDEETLKRILVLLGGDR